MKIANIVFNPFVNDSRVEKTSNSLANNGYKVEVIAHLDKGLKEYEKKGRYSVKRFVYLNRNETTSTISKLYIYIKWIKQLVKYTYNFDILHCNDLNTLPIGVIIKQFYNSDVKIVYDAHEYETEINGITGIKKQILKILEKFFMKYVNETITVSESISKEYEKLYNTKNTSVVLNTPLYKNIKKKNIFRDTYGIAKDQTIFLYQGNLSRGRGIEIIIDTFKELERKSVIVFMGYGELEPFIKEASRINSNIFFHEAVNSSVLLDYTSSADFGISTIEDTCLSYHYCLPNKMFEYIMAEVPVIVSNLPEMKKLVIDNNAGIYVKNNTVEGLKETINEALMIDRCKIKKSLINLKKIYNWEEQEKVLFNVYERL